jgi:glycosyltransferase involved in cell wall biosynthesis
MRIALDSRGSVDPRGIGRYVRCLVDALRTTAGPHELLEMHRPRGVDLFHAPRVEAALLRCTIPQVVTIHDLVILKRPGEYLRTGLRYRLRFLAASRAVRVIVPTHVVARDVSERLDVDPERIVVVGEAAAPAFRPRPDEEVARARAAHALPADYVVWVGGLEHNDPRKRVRELAAAATDIPVVLVGPTKPWASALPNVTLTGQVSDDELAAIMTGARALVFPSEDEGFGLPPVEALACGTPVVCMDIPALREVLGDRATYTDHGDVGALLEAASRVQRPAPAPLTRTWDDAARETWAVYETATAATHGPVP